MEEPGDLEKLAVAKLYEGETDTVLGMSAAGKSSDEIAEALGLRAFKVIDILSDPENEAKLALARKCTVQTVESSLARAGAKAVTALEGQLEPENDPAAILEASKILLNHHAKNVNVPVTSEAPTVPAIAIQVNLGNAEAKKIVTDRLRNHHDR